MRSTSQLALFPERERRESSAESMLVAAALDLGARGVAGWSAAEERLTRDLPIVSARRVSEIRSSILAGDDPLGDLFCDMRSAEERRSLGATFTPPGIVRAMVEWATDNGAPTRIVDPGVGSARFLVAAAQRFPAATLVGVEIDPLCAVIARANLAAAGFAGRSHVVLQDYRAISLPDVQGPTLYIGNPPYVRHHLLGAHWKKWLVREAARLGLKASQLAGLHVHFYLATASKGRPGDYGAFITAAEWLDVNYGWLVRNLFLGRLGGQQITLIEPAAMPFPDAATTAAVTYFQIGAKPPTIRFARLARSSDLAAANDARIVSRRRLAGESRWSRLTRPRRKAPHAYVELGELCSVHRGQVTGANRIWIEGPHSAGLPPGVLYPAVTKARELFAAGGVLADASSLRRVIDLPVDLGELSTEERKAAVRFLAVAQSLGADSGYIAHNRKAWWAVGLREPAPILATYMARRPPAFVRNRAAVRHLNIAHGIYPREPLEEALLCALAEHLSRSTCVTAGRTYAGGLTKFEPREMERLLVPRLEVLRQGLT